MITRLLSFSIPVLIILSQSACSDSQKGGSVELKNFEDSVAYALGYYIAYNNDEQDWDPVNADMMAKAMKIFYAEGDSAMKISRETAIGILNENGRRTLDKVREDNAAKGDAFLEKNSTAEGVVTTESGLQYKIIQEGTGAIPKPEDKIRFHYTGKFIDGEVFQSSRDRGPVELEIENLIRGWKEALVLMPVGSKWELYIPPKLAYGANGNEGIPPASTLIFELELLDIVPKENSENEIITNP
ncbi:MAG: FKBP-type peptidyl-prolyl cis-trans isomerase [Flavobacteriales bacterium]|nr:FKBP-type peptidyl-prolyl cis-trans isomerase [Flavobacteriales bacterium]